MVFFLFRKKPKKVINEGSSPSVVIQNLKNNILMQEKREKFLEKRISLHKIEAKKYIVSNNKKKAIHILKQVKITEKQLQNMYNIKYNIENQIYALEDGVVNIDNIKCMKDGLRAIQNINKQIDPDNVGELMDEIAENIETINEIGELMGHPLDTTVTESDEELLNSFEKEEKELEYNKQERELLKKPNVLDLPSVPKKELVTKEKTLAEKEKEELDQLTKELLV